MSGNKAGPRRVLLFTLGRKSSRNRTRLRYHSKRPISFPSTPIASATLTNRIIPIKSLIPKLSLAYPYSTLEPLVISLPPTTNSPEADDLSSTLSPEQIVEELDKNVIGQTDAKKAVAMALRNRWRRKQLSTRMQEEVHPMNILMIGPTGTGKTELARRLAKLAQSPFVKTEMTKYTEVGIYGSDVVSIMRDLVAEAIRLEKTKAKAKVNTQATVQAEARIITLLRDHPHCKAYALEDIRRGYKAGEFDHLLVEIDLRDSRKKKGPGGSRVQLGIIGGKGAAFAGIDEMMRHNFGEMFGGSPDHERGLDQRTLTVKEAAEVLITAFEEQLVDESAITRDAVKSAEQLGIVFLDEIDKLAGSIEYRKGGSKGEGVQKELLGLLEGTTVQTPWGVIDTSHILFIASGAFHNSKPSDLMPELQGRLPIRVTLNSLTEDDFLKILRETEYNLIDQQIAMLATEKIELIFTADACAEIAKMAFQLNSNVENIGARRLNTIIARVVSDISFTAGTKRKEAIAKGNQLYKEKIDAAYVKEKVSPLMEKTDLQKFVL